MRFLLKQILEEAFQALSLLLILVLLVAGACSLALVGRLLVLGQSHVGKHKVVAQVPHVVILLDVQANVLDIVLGLLRYVPVFDRIVVEAVGAVVFQHSRFPIFRDHINAILQRSRRRCLGQIRDKRAIDHRARRPVKVRQGNTVTVRMGDRIRNIDKYRLLLHRAHASDFLVIRHGLRNEIACLAGCQYFRGRVFLEITEFLSQFILVVNVGTLKGRAYATLGAGTEREAASEEE